MSEIVIEGEDESSTVGGPWVLATETKNLLMDFLGRSVLPFPKEMPIRNPFTQDSFYVRPCFHEYFDVIRSRLVADPKQRGVTITGSPGTSKSVFLGYFCLRYRLEYPDATIVMILNTHQAKTSKMVVWKDGKFQSMPAKPDVSASAFEPSSSSSRDIILTNGPSISTPLDHRCLVFGPSERGLRAEQEIRPTSAW